MSNSIVSHPPPSFQAFLKDQLLSFKKEGVLTFAKAAKLSSESLEGSIAMLSKLGIHIIHYTIKDVDEELKD